MILFPRHRAAVLTAFAFLIATVAIPTLHLAFHELPHDHAGAQTHYHAGTGDHEHEHPHSDARTDAEEKQPFDAQHGAGSVAHFSLALSEPAAAPFVLPLHGLTPACGVSSPAPVFLAAAHVSVQRFRGPPRA
jgi:hypothetical protein